MADDLDEEWWLNNEDREKVHSNMEQKSSATGIIGMNVALDCFFLISA